MVLNNTSYDALKAMETKAGLPDGQEVDSSAVRAKQSSQDDNGAGATKRGDSELIATKLDLHNSPEFKEFINLIYNSLKNHSEKSENNISLGTLSTLLKSTEHIAEKHNFTDSHKNLNAHHEELNKTHELNEPVDLSHNFKEKNIKSSVIEFIETIFQHEPSLISTGKEPEKKTASEEPKEKEYKNKFFGGIYKAIKPLVDIIVKNQVNVSLAGAASHGADAFAKISEFSDKVPSVPEGLEKPIGGISMWWSKAINPLANILQGIESLAENNIVDALARFSLIFKLGIKEPANLGIPVGLFLDHKMLMASAVNTGFVDKLQKQFGSFGESIKYHKDLYSGILKGYWKNFKEGKNPIKNLALLYSVPALGLSSLIGTALIKGDVNGPKAQILGFLRNTSGGFIDLFFSQERFEKVGKTIEKATGKKAGLADFLKDHEMQYWLAYLTNSIMDGTMRAWKDPVKTIIQSQFSNSVYEIANGLSGVKNPENDQVRIHEEIINKREKENAMAKNNIVNFNRIKELGSAIAANFNKEPAPAMA
ncbi:MAG: hypothetical protein HRT47_05215 [Candidatus Caenarcaniphilales bacterium]|nr:hypothetical protein [Candidatus Caenarcaniphilales bacterium]